MILPLCLIDPDLDCPISCPMFEEALDATVAGAEMAGVSVKEYKTQIRAIDPIQRAAMRSLTKWVAKSEGIINLCLNHEDAKPGIGFDR